MGHEYNAREDAGRPARLHQEGQVQAIDLYILDRTLELTRLDI